MTSAGAAGAVPTDALLGPRVAGRLEHVLQATVREETERVLGMSPDLGPVVDAVRAAVTGGKRLRGALVWWAWRGGPGDAGPKVSRAVEDVVLDVAASVELFHLAALVHDDVMDRSDVRRGRPTVRTAFGELHRTEGFAGEPLAFGDAVAVLVGDWCLVWSDGLLARAVEEVHDPLVRRAVRRIYDGLRSGAMAGQYLDLFEQQRRGTRLEDLRRVTTLKSAKYTVEQPLLLGATLAGAGPELLAGYSAYGLAVGEAFQLRDDLLGVFGDPTVTGKPAGEDLREGKRTWLVAVAEQRADARQRALLGLGLGSRALTATDLAGLREVLVETGAVDEVERRIARLVDDADDRLASMEIPTPVRSRLADIASACGWRVT